MSAEAEEIAAVWLDCDPGHDDAMAIILAGAIILSQATNVTALIGTISQTRTTVYRLAL